MRLGSDIAERLLDFAVVVVRLAGQLPRDPAGRHVASQLVRSATGGGANYEETRAAESREDFIPKVVTPASPAKLSSSPVGSVGVAAKEVRETVYWLELIHRSGWTTKDVTTAIREAGELAAILGASARTARARRACDDAR